MEQVEVKQEHAGCIMFVEELIDGLSPLALDAFFELRPFDDDEGGYLTLPAIAKSLGREEPEVLVALEELLPHDLADCCDDLLTSEGEPLGRAGYARYEDGERLLSVFSTLQHHENNFFNRHRIATETNLTALLDQAEEALGPFAKYADPRKVVAPDYQISPGSSFAKPQLTMGDCYSAAAALTAIRQGRGK